MKKAKVNYKEKFYQDTNSEKVPSENPKKGKKLSTEYSEALNEVSDINFDNVKTNLDLLHELRKVLINTLITSRGAFNAKPTQGNAATTARLVGDIWELSSAIEESIDYEEVAKSIFDNVINPFLDRALLDLGQLINDVVEKYGTSTGKRKALKRYFNEMYRNYGAYMETKMVTVNEQLLAHILEKTS